MNGINTEHKVYIKVLTPLHIGGAQEKHLQDGVDYLQYDNGETWKIDWSRLFKKYEVDEITEALLGNSLDQLISYSDLDEVAIRMNEAFGSTGEIKAFIRDGFGTPFIPGSSIKGALKSWFYTSFEKQHIEKETQNLLGKFETDLFRFVLPLDCTIKNELQLYPTKTFNLFKQGNRWRGGWKHSSGQKTNSDFDKFGFVTDYECIAPSSTGELTIKIRKTLNTSFLNELYRNSTELKKHYSMLYQTNSLDVLFKHVNGQVLEHINREIKFFDNYKDAQYCNEILECYENLKSKVESANDGECLLRLSAGSGFHGISGDHQFHDHVDTGIWTNDDAKKFKLSFNQRQQYVGNYIKFKSRKIAFTTNNMYPMGYVWLSNKRI